MATAPIRVLLVEDHALMRRGLAGQFSVEPDFDVVGEIGRASCRERV